jgi:hypothetical protein
MPQTPPPSEKIPDVLQTLHAPSGPHVSLLLEVLRHGQQFALLRAPLGPLRLFLVVKQPWIAGQDAALFTELASFFLFGFGRETSE